jgi:hypothetical protein
MSTRCQIEFRNGPVRRTVYRHSDGYPSAVIEDLLAFLAWSVRGRDVEYEAANFLYWSKREIAKRLPQHEQLGFGICSNDELHGDVEYYYVVENTAGGAVLRAYAVVHADGAARIGRLLQEVAVPQPLSSSFSSSHPMELPKVRMNGIWYFRDDRLREFRRCDNPHERITFDELLDAAQVGGATSLRLSSR